MRIRHAVLLALALTAAPLCAQTVRVWDAPLPDELLAADPADAVDLLREAGYEAATVTTDQLLDAAALTPERIDLLVIPTRGVYPGEGFGVLEDYLRAGGRVLSLGGVPFSTPLERGPNGWEQASVPTEPPGEVRVIADFGDVTPAIRTHGGEEDPATWEVVEDAGKRVLRASVEDLQQWQYIDVPMTDTGDASFSVLHFRIKGDATTDTLGIEMNEADASRWKYVIPLTEDWREWNIYIPHFLSYATEDRGGEGDYLHPERLATLSFGITKGMVGAGPHTFMIDDVERWQFEPPAREVVPLDRSIVAATARAYGDPVIVPPDQRSPLISMFDDATRFEDEELLGEAAQYSGWAIDVPTGSGPAYSNVVMSPKRIARVTPLVSRRSGGTVAGVVQVHDDDLAGAIVGFFALDTGDLLGDRNMRSAALFVAEYMTRRPLIADVLPEFTVADGQAVMTLRAQVVGPPQGCSAQMQVTVGVVGGGPEWSEQRTIELAPRERATAEVTVPVSEFDPANYQVNVNVSEGDAADDLRIEVDAMALMTRLCDFFVAMQDEDGVTTGLGFVDERAARALLVMYDLTGKQEYLDAAIRWGDNEIAMQREDGGYRMGYGIFDSGEACYVADGGEIAIGMARLVSYVPEARRQAYLDSLRTYFAYRESFRLDDETISVGWVFSERFSQAGGEGRRDAPFRSDRSFGFVTACTLAAAAAYQHITGDPADRAMAIHDARWFLDDVAKTTSVSAEAAQWAHYFIENEALRADLATRMRETLLPYALEGSGWWYASGGRSAVTLGALSYYHSQIDPAPEALAAMGRGVYRMVSPHSPASMDAVIDAGSPTGDEWRYLAYGAVSLAEVLEPLSTMEDIAP